MLHEEEKNNNDKTNSPESWNIKWYNQIVIANIQCVLYVNALNEKIYFILWSVSIFISLDNPVMTTGTNSSLKPISGSVELRDQ